MIRVFRLLAIPFDGIIYFWLAECDLHLHGKKFILWGGLAQNVRLFMTIKLLILIKIC